MGIASNRFGLTPWQFYRLSPREFHFMLEDFNDTYFSWVKLIAQVLRKIGVSVHNSAFGRKSSDMIRDPKNYIRFGWEKPKIQTVEEMKQTILGLAHIQGVEVTQNGSKIKFEET